LYSFLLAWSLADNTALKTDFVFVEYGGGTGVLSLLAKELGIGSVIYNDIYDVSCHDAQLIAKAIGNDADGYVCGDIDDLISYLKRKQISVDAICSHDVIEHIYDVESYIRKLRLVSYRPLRVVFSSNANIHNPMIRKRLMKKHIEAENKDRNKKWGHKERDSLRSYRNIRKDIISLYDSSLNDNKINYLAKKTRGLFKDDIHKCVEEYNKTGSIAYKPNHSTNTCDPYTGNWAEHLMDTNHIKKIFQDESFNIQVFAGYYGFSYHPVKHVVGNFLNKLIKNLKSKGINIAPYYVLYARHCQK
jgi:hypothetical protein